jgi:hypothetical protein
MLVMPKSRVDAFRNGAHRGHQECRGRVLTIREVAWFGNFEEELREIFMYFGHQGVTGCRGLEWTHFAHKGHGDTIGIEGRFYCWVMEVG